MLSALSTRGSVSGARQESTGSDVGESAAVQKSDGEREPQCPRSQCGKDERAAQQLGEQNSDTCDDQQGEQDAGLSQTGRQVGSVRQQCAQLRSPRWVPPVRRGASAPSPSITRHRHRVVRDVSRSCHRSGEIAPPTATAAGSARSGLGNEKVNRAPPDVRFSAVTSPPCRRAFSRAIARPSPLPSERVRAPSLLKNRSKTCGSAFSSIPGPQSSTVTTRVAAWSSHHREQPSRSRAQPRTSTRCRRGSRPRRRTCADQSPRAPAKGTTTVTCPLQPRRSRHARSATSASTKSVSIRAMPASKREISIRSSTS